MQIVECPHCATRVANDGSLSERAVTCPVCAQQFHMPAYTPPPPPPPAPPAEAESSGESSLSDEAPEPSGFRARKKQPRSRAWLWLTILGSTAVFWLVVFVVLLATDFRWLRRSGSDDRGNKARHGGSPGKGRPSR
jgi:hypothetical protein